LRCYKSSIRVCDEEEEEKNMEGVEGKLKPEIATWWRQRNDPAAADGFPSFSSLRFSSLSLLFLLVWL
jgi:hypothetical protein